MASIVRDRLGVLANRWSAEDSRIVYGAVLRIGGSTYVPQYAFPAAMSPGRVFHHVWPRLKIVDSEIAFGSYRPQTARPSIEPATASRSLHHFADFEDCRLN